MFCPKCGKTLPYDVPQCPSCGLSVGESRFEGSPYTSAQAHIRPGDNVRELLESTYTRSAYSRPAYTPSHYEEPDYTQHEEMAAGNDADDSTAYQPEETPAYAGEEIPSFSFDAEKPDENASEPETFAGEGAPVEDIEDDLTIEALDMSRFRARPIEAVAQSGISADVSERMQNIESEPPRRLRGFGRRRPVYDDYADQDSEDIENSVPEQTADVGMDDETAVFDDIDEEYEEIRHSEFGLKQIFKIVLTVVVIAALVVGGVLWMNYIRGNQSDAPIENVRDTLYNDGVALIENHASTANVEKVITDYSAGGDLTTLQSQLTAFAATVSALSPEDATENEQIFVQALQKIESNITNCIISDAIAIGSNDAGAAAESDERWKVVNNSITMLKAAKSTAELTAIINGEVIDIQQQAEATATPEPAVNYNTLSKGDKSDEVVEMQTRLYELGYLSETPDGQFGSKTQTAVKIFQQMAGIPVTGIADNDTLTALYDEGAPEALLVD